MTIRYNDFTDGLWDDCWPTRVYGNLFRDGTNLNDRAGTDNLRVSDSAFVDAAKATSISAQTVRDRRRVDPQLYPRRRQGRQARPIGKRADAGAYEPPCQKR